MTDPASRGPGLLHNLSLVRRGAFISTNTTHRHLSPSRRNTGRKLRRSDIADDVAGQVAEDLGLLLPKTVPGFNAGTGNGVTE